MMSLQDTLSNYWEALFLAPLAYIGTSFVSLKSKVSVHESKISALEKTCENLCAQSQKQTELLSNIEGQLKEHFRSSTPR